MDRHSLEGAAMTDPLREALAELETAEAHYRLIFQTAPSADHLDVGRAWDRMRKAGDAARAALAQPAVSEPVAALIRFRYVMTPARDAHDMKDHFSDWGDWTPATYSHAKAVTDPVRNTDPLLYEMRPLCDITAPTQPAEPDYDAEFIGLQREELAALPDAAIAAGFRDIAGRRYSTAPATLFRAHVIEKARKAALAQPGDDTSYCPVPAKPVGTAKLAQQRSGPASSGGYGCNPLGRCVLPLCPECPEIGFPVEPPREPLTDEQIDAACKTVPAAAYELMRGHEITLPVFRNALREIARAVLAAAQPAVQPPHEPLTDEQIEAYWFDSDLQPQILGWVDVFHEGARFAERAHGITAAQEGKP